MAKISQRQGKASLREMTQCHKPPGKRSRFIFMPLFGQQKCHQRSSRGIVKKEKHNSLVRLSCDQSSGLVTNLTNQAQYIACNLLFCWRSIRQIVRILNSITKSAMQKCLLINLWRSWLGSSKFPRHMIQFNSPRWVQRSFLWHPRPP